MRTAIPVLALVCGALGCDPDVGGNEPIGGGGGGGGNQGPDAGTAADAAPGDGQVTGRVCQALDLHTPDLCPNVGNLGDITVTLVEAGASTTTAADGSFTLPASDTGIATIRAAAGDPVYRSSITPFAADNGAVTGVRVPMLTEDDYQVLRANVGFADEAGVDATIVVYTRASSDDDPVASVLVEPVGAVAVTYYDTVDPLIWNQDQAGTGPNGVALITGVNALAADTVDLRVTLAQPGSLIEDVPIAPDTITFITATLPAQ